MEYNEVCDEQGNVYKQQTGGSHYQKLKITPVEYAMKNNLNACEFSVVKYISRHRWKNGKEDLLKANPKLTIDLCDERLSTVSAHKSLNELNVNHKQRKDSVDRIAACIILDTYLAMKGNK